MQRYLHHTNICEGCGDTFRSTRSDARTCSAKCRKRISRKPNRCPRCGYGSRPHGKQRECTSRYCGHRFTPGEPEPQEES